jgi:hypothetical protein
LFEVLHDGHELAHFLLAETEMSRLLGTHVVGHMHEGTVKIETKAS